MKEIKIYSRLDNTVLFVHEQEGNTIRATLEKAIKDGANLKYSNLIGANLRGANLIGANLRGANLRGANLRGANLIGANFIDANLKGANLKGANLEGANLEGATHNLVIPKIEDIHQKVAELVTEDNLNMGKWHCGTTHCHAGHIVNIAGQEGYDLESIVGTSTAALMIVDKSSEIKVTSSMFYVDDEAGMTNIKILAKKEKELK